MVLEVDVGFVHSKFLSCLSEGGGAPVMPYAAPRCVVWLIGRKILKMTKFVWMCVIGSGAHLKVCGHALLVAPLVPGPGRPFDDEFSTLGCRGRSVARSPVAEGRVRKVWQNTMLAAAAPDMRAHSNLFAPPASYSHGEKEDRHCAAEATAGSSHAPPPR